MEIANSVMLFESDIWTGTLEIKKVGKFTCIGTENTYIAYHIGITYGVRRSRTCGNRYNAYLLDLLAAEMMKIYKEKSAGYHITGHFKENTISFIDKDRC